MTQEGKDNGRNPGLASFPDARGRWPGIDEEP